MVVSDDAGIDWREFYRRHMEGLNWTPRQIAEDVTLPQLLALWAEPKDAPEVLTNPSRAEWSEIVGRLRAKAQAKEGE